MTGAPDTAVGASHHPEAAPADGPGPLGGPGPDEGRHGPTDRGSVVLDIGGTIGALVLHTTVDLLGAELEVALVGADPHAHRTHTAVRERRGGPQVQYGAIYAALPAGAYIVYGVDGHPADTVTITGGEVATLDWRHH